MYGEKFYVKHSGAGKKTFQQPAGCNYVPYVYMARTRFRITQYRHITIDRCIAKAVYTAALFEETPPLYIEAAHEQCCNGGRVWMGLAEPHPKLKYFVTVGTPDFHGGAAEHLKASPELFEEYMKRAGKITPPGNYTVIGPCTDDIAPEDDQSSDPVRR